LPSTIGMNYKGSVVRRTSKVGLILSRACQDHIAACNRLRKSSVLDTRGRFPALSRTTFYVFCILAVHFRGGIESCDGFLFSSTNPLFCNGCGGVFG